MEKTPGNHQETSPQSVLDARQTRELFAPVSDWGLDAYKEFIGTDLENER